MCHARPVDPWFVASIVLAIALALAITVARRRDLEVRRARLAVSVSPDSPSGDLVSAVSRLQAQADDDARALAHERLERANLADTLESGVIRVDAALQIVEANDLAHGQLGRPAGSLIGRSLMEAFLDETAESVARAALEAGVVGAELRPAGPDGAVIALRARRSGTGGAWLVLEDVSELRRLQRIRTEFIDNLSHELRTPLTTVSLLAETLSREAAQAGDEIPPRMRERIEKIEIETGHLVQMVNELLDLSRIESGGTLEFADGVDLGRLAADSAERLRLFAERQGVSLRIERSPGALTVRGDAARLGQVVVNLVHNAVKFSPDGGDVVVRTEPAGGEVVVSVEDHGVGIPAGARERVFERFYKVDRARLRAEVGGGTGLGLAIARHVVEQHGGRIWVHSREGKGSTFSFALPTSPAPAR